MEKDGQFDLVKITAEDWRLWRNLRLQALKDAPYAFGSRLTDWQGPGDLEMRWRERLGSVRLNLVAVLNEEPVGMVSATAPDPQGTVELISMWVTPLARGLGIGNALVEAVIHWAEQQEARCISLDVKEGNRHAIELYRRHQFVDVGGPPPMVPVDLPEIRLLRNLVFS